MGTTLVAVSTLSLFQAVADTGEDLSPLGGLDITDLDLVDLLRAPMVESATRRQQSLDESPSAMDVFDGDDPIFAGVASIADLLRRVPGAYVMQVSAGRFNVGLRGVNALANNRVVVLINGRRLSEVDHGSPSWQNFPVHVGEIERVEVLRGPGTTLYGSDGVSGIIHIVTKRPLDYPGLSGMFSTGVAWLPDQPGDLQDARVTNLGLGYATFAAANRARTLGVAATAGWNHAPDWVDADARSIRLHGDFGYHLGATLDYRPSPRTTLFVDARHVESEGLRGASDTLTTQRLFAYAKEQSLTVAFRSANILPTVDLSVNADARRLSEYTKLYPDRYSFGLAVQGSTPDDRPVMQDPGDYRAHAIAQADSRLWEGRQVLSLAAESSYQHTSRFFGDTISQTYFAAVVQSETRLLREPGLLFNLGLRAEQVTLGVKDDYESTIGHISPRASLIAKLSQHHALRLTWATAYRTPSLWEVSDKRNAVYTYPAPVPPSYFMIGNPALRPEEVQSIELGYQGRPARWLRVDATAYVQELKGSIQFLKARIPLMYENGPDRRQTGLELGVKIRPLVSLDGSLSYALTRTTSVVGGDAHAFPSHLLHLGTGYQKHGVRLNADLNIIAGTQLLRMQASQSGIVKNRLTTQGQYILNLRAGRSMLDGAAELFLSASNTLALFRNRNDLVQFPSASADPIGVTILLGLVLRNAPFGGAR